MGLKVVNQLEVDRWRQFVDSHTQGNIFHIPEMFEVYSNAQGYSPSLWAVLDDDGQIQALHIPIQITLMGGFLHFFTTRDVNFGSVLAIDNEKGRKGLSLLLKEYKQHVPWATLFTELRNFSDLSCFRDIFQQNGYKYKNHLNYYVVLDRDQYELLQSFNRSARRNIRSAIRNGTPVVKEISEPEMLPLFYEIIKKTYTHANIPLADFSLFKSAFDILVPKKMARFTVAFVNGVPASAAVYILYKDVVFGWYNGVDRSFRSYSPNEFILWEGMKWGIENGYKIFDFGGAGDPDEESGVRNFKLKFNGELIEYGRNVCIHAPFRLNLAETVFERGRKIFRLWQI